MVELEFVGNCPIFTFNWIWPQNIAKKSISWDFWKLAGKITNHWICWFCWYQWWSWVLGKFLHEEQWTCHWSHNSRADNRTNHKIPRRPLGRISKALLDGKWNWWSFVCIRGFPLAKWLIWDGWVWWPKARACIPLSKCPDPHNPPGINTIC